MSSSSPIPEADRRWIFRNVVDLCLRSFVAYMAEGDVVHEYGDIFKEDLIRGEVASNIDLALSPPRGRFIGIEIKTLVVACRQEGGMDTRVDRRDSPLWRGSIGSHTEAQTKCDVWSIHFPLLCDPAWRALIDPQTPGFFRRKPPVAEYRHSEAGQRLDHVVPSALWPVTTSLMGSAQVLSSLSNHKHDLADEAIRIDDFEFSVSKDATLRSTSESLKNHGQRREHGILRFFHDRFRDRNLPFITRDTEYQPYTADLAFEHTSGLTAFAELKIGYCTLKETINGLRISHRSAYAKRGHPIFTYSGGRWTYLVTGLGGENFMYGSIHVPRYVVFIHRDDLPTNWWHSKQDKDGELFAWVKKAQIVDLKSDFPSKMTDILEQDLRSARFGLPRLESFANITQAQLSLLYSRAVLGAKRSPPRPDKSRATQRPSYNFQAIASCNFLHSCREARQGLIYDWQHKCRNLRSYAFTAYDWSTAETAYTLARPRRPPVQVFQLPVKQSFLFLSFGMMRNYSENDTVYVHPFVLETLRQDQLNSSFLAGRRVLVLTAEEELSMDDSLSTSIYAVPENAIDCSQHIANHTRYTRLILKDGKSIDQYKHNDMEEVVGYLTSSLGAAASSADPASQDQDIPIATRGELYAAIKQWTLEYRQRYGAKSRIGDDDAAAADDGYEVVLNEDFSLC